jgi:Fe-S cluster biogenesis protein NfuA
VIIMNIEEKIKINLTKIKPLLNSDDGDIKFVKYKNGIVYIKLLGTCNNCARANIILKSIVENILTSKIPEVIKIKITKD